MPTIQAMDNGQEKGLECLGDLRMMKTLRFGSLKLERKVSVAGAGSYKKKIDAPFYRPKTINRWRQTPAGKDQKLLGAVPLKSGKEAPVGYVQRQQGAHTFCLAVRPVAKYTGVGWRVIGYLLTSAGCVAVVRRRVLFWVVLLLAAVATFFISYTLFANGFSQGLGMIFDTIKELPRTIVDRWYAFWHKM